MVLPLRLLGINNTRDCHGSSCNKGFSWICPSSCTKQDILMDLLFMLSGFNRVVLLALWGINRSQDSHGFAPHAVGLETTRTFDSSATCRVSRSQHFMHQQIYTGPSITPIGFTTPTDLHTPSQVTRVDVLRCHDERKQQPI